VCELPEKKFKRTILRKLSKIKLIQKGNPEKTYMQLRASTTD
jgi:hypothetical protein